MHEREVAQHRIGKIIPMVGWRKDYPRGWLRIVHTSGVSAAAVVILQAV